MNTTTNNTNTNPMSPEAILNRADQRAAGAPVMSPADKLRAKLAAGAAAKTAGATPITPKALFTELDKPGTVEAFIDSALDGTERAPLVVLASHVNRSENLKAASAAIKYADIAAKYAPKYGLTAPEFIRLLAKLVIQDYNPAALEAPEEAPAQEPIATPEELAAAHAATLNQTPAQEPAGDLFETGTSEAPAPTEAPTTATGTAPAAGKAKAKAKGRK